MTEVVIKAPKISPEEYKKYRGKNVAIYKNKIIAEGTTQTKHCKKPCKNIPNSNPNK